MAGLTSLQVSEDSAAQFSEGLRQYNPAVTPPEEAQDAIHTALKLADLALTAWDAVQRLVDKGSEGGRARALVGKVYATIGAWLVNVRAVIGWVPQWREQGGAPLSGLDQLRDIERRLEEAHSLAERLLAFVNEPPPSLAPEILERSEAAGAADDNTQYLSAQDFLARVRARRGA